MARVTEKQQREALRIIRDKPEYKEALEPIENQADQIVTELRFMMEEDEELKNDITKAAAVYARWIAEKLLDDLMKVLT